jgi:hypothetical protein
MWGKSVMIPSESRKGDLKMTLRRMVVQKFGPRVPYYTSKYYENRGCWWVEIPVKRLEQHNEIMLFLYNQNNKKFKQAVIPTRFLLEKINQLDVREDRDLVSLFLTKGSYIDVRGRGRVDFSEFF